MNTITSLIGKLIYERHKCTCLKNFRVTLYIPYCIPLLQPLLQHIIALYNKVYRFSFNILNDIMRQDNDKIIK